MNRYERRLHHQKNTTNTTGNTVPQSAEGASGDVTIRNIAGQIRIYAKYGQNWYGRDLGPTVVLGETNKKHVQIGSGGINIKDGTVSIASFGDTLRIGKTTASAFRVKIASDGIYLKQRSADGATDSNRVIVNGTQNLFLGEIQTDSHFQAQGNITTTAGQFTGAGTGLTGTASSLSIGGSAATAGTAGTVTTAAQSNITSLGTLTSLTVDYITLNGNTISDAGNLTLDVGGNCIIDANGVLLIGRTSIVSTNKDPIVEIDGPISFDGFISRAGTGGSDNGDHIMNLNWDGSNLEGWVADIEVVSAITSDYRVKENITNVADGVLEKINALRPIHYTQKAIDIFQESSLQRTSFLAHEFAEQFPNSVKGTKDETDSDGTNIYQKYKDEELGAYLVKAVQELSAKVTALEAKI